MHRWWNDRQPSFQPSASTVGADPAPPCPAKLGLLASPLLSLVENLPPPSFARSMVRSGPPMVVADLAISSGYSNRSSGGREWNYSLGMLPPCLASWAWCLQLHQTLLSSSIVTNCEGNSLKGWGYEIAYIAGKGDSASACVSGALRSTLARLEQPKAGERGWTGGEEFQSVDQERETGWKVTWGDLGMSCQVMYQAHHPYFPYHRTPAQEPVKVRNLVLLPR